MIASRTLALKTYCPFRLQQALADIPPFLFKLVLVLSFASSVFLGPGFPLLLGLDFIYLGCVLPGKRVWRSGLLSSSASFHVLSFLNCLS